MATRTVTLVSGPMDGWAVPPTAPVLRPGWAPLEPRRSLLDLVLRRQRYAVRGRYVPDPTATNPTARWREDGTSGTSPADLWPIAVLALIALGVLAAVTGHLFSAADGPAIMGFNIGSVFLALLADAARLKPQVEAAAREAGDAGAKTLGDRLSKGLQNVGKSLSTAGRSMSTYITAPIVAAGAAIFKVGKDFDTTLRQIVALTDVTGDEIGTVKDAIIALSGETGKVPQELADGFYFLASAGFKTNEALEVLQATAKASAVGLGTTADISKVVGAAINAFGRENLTATSAVDQLLRAIKDGTAEAPQFANSLGNVMGSAAQMGATFADTTAAIAAMTLKGIGVEEATTSLNQVFVSLIKPTKQAETALEELGLSSAGLRTQLREKGLLSVLQTLAERFGTNETAAGEVFGNVRALRGILALTNDTSGQTAAIFEDVANGTANLGEALKETDGPGRAFDKAMARIQVALIQLSDDVLPLVADWLDQVSGMVSGVAGFFASLPGPVKSAVVQFLAFAAALGPVLFFTGKVASGVGQLIGIVDKLGKVKIGANTVSALVGQFTGALSGGISGAIAKVKSSTAVTKAAAGLGTVLGSTMGKALSVAFAAIAIYEVFATYNQVKDGLNAQVKQISSDVANQIKTGTLADLEQSKAALQTGLSELNGVYDLGLFSNDTRAQLTTNLNAITAAIDARKAGISTAAKGVAAAIADPITGAADEASTSVEQSMNDILTALTNTRSSLSKAASDAADAVFGPVIAKANLSATEKELADARAIASGKAYTQAQIDAAEKNAKTDAQKLAASKMHTAEEIADAKTRVTELSATEVEQYGILASFGDKAAADWLLNWAQMTLASKDSSAEQVIAARDIIEAYKDLMTVGEQLRSKLGVLAGLTREQIVAKYSVSPTGDIPDIPGYARGGIAAAGQPYWSGERGPELNVPLTPTLVVPSNLSRALTGLGAPATTNITNVVNLPTTARPDPFQVAAEMRRQADMGMFG